MTWFHFLNCTLLTYTPFFVVDRAAKPLNQVSRRISLYRQCFIIYIVVQIAKMVAAATLAATVLPAHQEASSVATISMNAVLGLLDIAGIAYVLKGFTGASNEAKVIIAGLGWAGADAVFSKILPLWVGARGAEFSWEYLQMGMDANLRIGIYIALAALVHMQSTQGASTLLMAVAVILAMLPWLSSLAPVLNFGGLWGSLIIEAAGTVVLGLLTQVLFPRK